MMFLKLLKSPIAGFLIGAILTFALYPVVEGYWKKPVQLVCNPAPCNCPEQKPCQGIDFDKIKSKYITIQNEQHLTIKGDSLVEQKIREVIVAELSKLKLAPL